MTPLWLTGIPQADPLPQPGPTWLLWTLLLVTFVLHLVPMNLVLGGAVLNVVARWRARRGAPHAPTLAHDITKAMPVAIAAAVNFGVAPLLFLQVLYGRVFFTSSVLMAWWWLAVVPILIAAYYGAYVLSFRADRPGRGATALAWLVLLLVAAISFIYANNMSLMIRPDVFGESLPRRWAGLASEPRRPDARRPLAAHGARRTGRRGRRRRGAGPRAAPARRRLRCVGHATRQPLVRGGDEREHPRGLLVAGAAAPDSLLRFMGRDAAATFVLAIGTLTGLGVLVASWLGARAERPAPLAWATIGFMGVTLVMMALTRDQARWGS